MHMLEINETSIKYDRKKCVGLGVHFQGCTCKGRKIPKNQSNIMKPQHSPLKNDYPSVTNSQH